MNPGDIALALRFDLDMERRIGRLYRLADRKRRAGGRVPLVGVVCFLNFEMLGRNSDSQLPRQPVNGLHAN